MTSRQSARLAGVLFLAYIATGLTQMALNAGGTPAGAGPAEQLAAWNAHPLRMRVDVLLTLLTAFEALFLGGALYALTRRVDEELARLGLLCRVAEGVLNAAGAARQAGHVGLATAVAAASGPDRDAVLATGATLLQQGGGTVLVSGTCFGVGSALFAWLLLRGRLVPGWLARLGVAASLLVAVLLPARWLGLPGAWMVVVIWLPMLVFEVGLAIRLLTRGIAAPGTVHVTG